MISVPCVSHVAVVVVMYCKWKFDYGANMIRKEVTDIGVKGLRKDTNSGSRGVC